MISFPRAQILPLCCLPATRCSFSSAPALIVVQRVLSGLSLLEHVGQSRLHSHAYMWVWIRSHGSTC